MKNLFLISTDKPSKLYSYKGNLFLTTESHLNVPSMKYQNIYITSDEEIKEGDYVYSTSQDYNIQKVLKQFVKGYNDVEHYKKIILTTDQDLIKDGIQAIDNKFLEWFVKNPSCEEVEVEEFEPIYGHQNNSSSILYKIIIPKEEPKQETLEEAAEKEFPLMDTEWCRTGACEEENFQLLGHRRSFIKGAKWQTERMYSKEEVIAIVEKSRETGLTAEYLLLTEQFKKK